MSPSGESVFFHRNPRMSLFKIIIQKCDMPDDHEAICEDYKFICIVEMTVDVFP